MEAQAQNVFVSIAIGAFASLVAAGVFLAFLRAIRPKIVICDHIARSAGVYTLKIKNPGWFQLIDLKMSLELVHVETAPPDARPLMTLKPIPLKTERWFNLSGYSKKDAEGSYAVRFAVVGDLESQWPPGLNNYLLFRVAATHSLSGFRAVFSKRFTRGAVMNGAFHFGVSCEIGG